MPSIPPVEWEEINPFNIKIANEFLEQSHLSPSTLTQYKSALKIFFKWVFSYRENKPLYELKPKDAIAYQNYITNQGLYPKSVKLKRSVVASVCGYFEIYYLDEYPTFRNIFNKYVPNVSNEFKFKKECVSKEEMLTLTNELRRQNKIEMLAYIWFTYISGARRAEVAQLKKEVIHYQKEQGKQYYLTHPIRTKGKGKEGNVRKIPFNDIAMIYLKEWMNIRGDDQCPFMFLFKSEKPNGDKFNRWCKHIFSDILNKRVHPHMFRRTRATHLIQDGASIEATQELLGHKDASTTKIYIMSKEDNLTTIF